MPVKEIIFTVKLPLKMVWSFIADRHEVGCLFPGCKGVKILNDMDSIWTVRLSLGPFSRTVDIFTHNTEFKKGEKIAWDAKAELFKSSGSIALHRISEDETEVTYRIEAHVIGPLSMLQDIVAAEKLGEITRQFVKNLKERLEWTAESEAEKK